MTYCTVKFNNKISTYFQNHAKVHRSQNAYTVCDLGHVSGRAKVTVLELSMCCTVCAAVQFSVTSSVCVL